MSKLNYERAYNELLEIVQEIEQNQVGIDELNKKLKRAAELIKFCKNKLRDTESKANELINQIDDAN
jgi:exodeoxyribonuclease VII small subunit